MQKYIFPLTEGRHFKVGNVSGFAINNEDSIDRGDVAFLEVRGVHGKVKDLVSCRFYTVTKGTGTFNIESNVYAVQKNDVIIIPPNTTYDFEGNMDLVMFCSPAFDIKNEIQID